MRGNTGKCMVLAMLLCIALVSSTMPVSATATTEVTVTKYAANNYSTVLNETTVNYTWMEANLQIYGDGVTHYYFQGPIFQSEWEAAHPNGTWNDTPICAEDTIPGTTVTFTNAPDCIEADRWNPEEDTNCGGPEGSVPKDLGAVKGTDVNDLCDLVGGLSAGDSVNIQANDNFAKEFPAEVFYDPDPAVGRGILCWYTKDSQESFSGTGYVPNFTVGMRLAFLADNTTNPWGEHIFGLKNMVENFPSYMWHYYYGGMDGFYPSCGGFQIKYVDRINIYPPHLHDFNDTGDTVGWAFGNHTPTLPSTPDIPSTEFNSTAYGSIATDDAIYQSDTAISGKAAHRFNFSINTSTNSDGPIANIEKLNITWNGKGLHDYGSINYQGATLYIWNGGGYELLQASAKTYEEVTLTDEITSDISNYINSGNVTVLVRQNAPTFSSYYSRIQTDYVSLEVTHHN